MKGFGGHPFSKMLNKVYKWLCNCPRRCSYPIWPNRLLQCDKQRDKIHGHIFDTGLGWQVGFLNELTDYPENHSRGCETRFGPLFHRATVEELNDSFTRLTLLEMLGNCPLEVWSTNNGVPTLVKVVPGSINPVRILPTPSLSFLAYTIFIDTGLY
jgi:hypothetical protein